MVFTTAVVAACGDDSSSNSETVTVGSASEVAIDEPTETGLSEPASEKVLADLPQLRRASGEPQVPAIRGSAGLTVPEWLNTVNLDINNYWQQEFNLAGYRYRPARQLIFDSPVKTRCFKGQVLPSDGPFYCLRDRTIYLPVDFFVNEARRFGDAGVAVVVAHENGHRLQHTVGVFRRPYLTIQTELQADCLAGVWAASVYRRRLLETGDIGEILGEVKIAGDAKGVPVDDPTAHGNSRLRRKAFLKGYVGGQPSACPVPSVPRGWSEAASVP